MSYSAAKNSRFRHIFTEPKKELFSLRGVANPAAENYGIQGNSKFFGACVGGGSGKLAIVPLSQFGVRVLADPPAITGHSGKILDFAFSPYDENQVLTGAEDNLVKVWQIPEEGLESNMNDCIAELTGHQKKVNLVQYHNTAENIVASASHDSSVRLWDLTQSASIFNVSVAAEGNNITYSLSFNEDGSQFVTASKDKTLRIYDARTGEACSESEGHEGAKAQLATWMTKKNFISTIGFNKQSARQLWLWDPRNMKQRVSGFDIDIGAGVFMPMYDPDLDLLFLAGKGDSTIFWTEINESNEIIRVGDVKPAGPPLKCVCMLPKTAGDIMKCEVNRILRIRGDENVEILPMIVPRKASDFQEDIFPDTAAPEGVPADEWRAGTNKKRPTMSLRPGGEARAAKKVIKTPMQYEKELKDKNAKIKELEAKVAELEKRLAKA